MDGDNSDSTSSSSSRSVLESATCNSCYYHTMSDDRWVMVCLVAHVQAQGRRFRRLSFTFPPHTTTAAALAECATLAEPVCLELQYIRFRVALCTGSRPRLAVGEQYRKQTSLRAVKGFRKTERHVVISSQRLARKELPSTLKTSGKK